MTGVQTCALRSVLRMLAASGRDPVDVLAGAMPRLRKASKCPACRAGGYAGRTTIYELLTTTTRIRDVILSSGSEAAIERAAASDGMMTMLQNGLGKALGGETTPEEVLRVTRFDACQDTDTELTTKAAP